VHAGDVERSHGHGTLLLASCDGWAKTFLPGEQPQDPSFVGWVAAEMFEAAANRSADPTTAAFVLEGLWALNGDTAGDTTHPLRFSRNQNAPKTVCWATAVVKGGAFVYTPTGSTLKCK
jgi:hypothetical protein